jgi:predicted DNA binding CopG/RHH family protein
VKKTLPLAKTPLPKFPSDEAAADYFAAHSMAGAWESLSAAKPAKLSKELAKAIEKRHATRKSPISIRLGSEQIVAAKRIAAAKSVGYQTQLRMWIAEGIRREGKA